MLYPLLYGLADDVGGLNVVRYVPFRVSAAYRHVRHPGHLGWLLILWATPEMTSSRLLLAAALTLYVLAAIPFEERDLVAAHGRSYALYRRRVPRLIPALRPRRLPASPSGEWTRPPS